MFFRSGGQRGKKRCQKEIPYTECFDFLKRGQNDGSSLLKEMVVVKLLLVIEVINGKRLVGRGHCCRGVGSISM